MMRKLGLVASALVTTNAFCGSVWEDADVLLFSNFSGGPGTVVCSSSRWVNDRNTAKVVEGAYKPTDIDAALSAAIQGMYIVTNETVRILGEGGVTYENEPCLHFTPYVDGDGQYHSTFFTLPGAKKGTGSGEHAKLDLTQDNTYTVCLRFKPGLCTPSAELTDRCLLEMGPGNGNDGLQIMYKVAPEGTYGYIYARQSANVLSVGSYGGGGNCELMVTNGVWADIAVICASNRIDVGVRHEYLFRKDDRGLEYLKTQGGRRFTWLSGSYDPVATGKSLVPPYNYNRFNNSWNWGAKTEADCRSIAGSLHRYGFWSRALNRDEVYEYFSEAKRPNLLTVGPGGTGTGGEKMFRGTAGTAVTIVNRPGEWRKLPAVLNRGVANTVNFTVEPQYAGLPQVLKLSSAAGKASGTVLVKLDGNKLAELDVPAGGKAMAMIDGAVFTAGSHALSYERSDAGSGQLILNALELKGSWQVGKDDGVYKQSATVDDFTVSHIFSWGQYGYCPASAANGWLCDFPSTPRHAFYGTQIEIYDMSLSFPVDPDLIAARYRFRYEMKIASIQEQWSGTKWTYTMNFNGTEKSFSTGDYKVGDVVKVPIDECVVGGSNTNRFSIRVSDPGQGPDGKYSNTVHADYYRLRLLSPLNGMVMTIR